MAESNDRAALEQISKVPIICAVAIILLPTPGRRSARTFNTSWPCSPSSAPVLSATLPPWRAPRFGGLPCACDIGQCAQGGGGGGRRACRRGWRVQAGLRRVWHRGHCNSVCAPRAQVLCEGLKHARVSGLRLTGDRWSSGSDCCPRSPRHWLAAPFPWPATTLTRCVLHLYLCKKGHIEQTTGRYCKRLHSLCVDHQKDNGLKVSQHCDCAERCDSQLVSGHPP